MDLQMDRHGEIVSNCGTDDYPAGDCTVHVISSYRCRASLATGTISAGRHQLYPGDSMTSSIGTSSRSTAATARTSSGVPGKSTRNRQPAGFVDMTTITKLTGLLCHHMIASQSATKRRPPVRGCATSRVLPGGEPVNYQTQDGVRIAASWFFPKRVTKPPVVILLSETAPGRSGTISFQFW